MNEIIKSLYDRKSVRVFEDIKIDDETKQCIINAAIQAPTAGNQTLYTILDIEDQGIKDRLAVSCDNQPFIASAPMVLVFLADCRRWYDFYGTAGEECRTPGVGDLFLACQDAAIAAQNAVVAAESMGIGSCYIGDILENMEEHVELLNLDEFTVPCTMLVFGYPTEQQKKRLKPLRFENSYIVQKNTYRRFTEEEQHEMFAKQKGDDFDFKSYISAFCRRKYMSSFSLEMTRSVSKYLERFK